MKTFSAVLLVLALAVSVGQAYDLKAVVLDCGGVPLTSAGYRCGLSVGQAVASGTLTSSGYHAILGFWGPHLQVGIGEDAGQATLPASYSLSQNCPNPFRNRTVVRYSLPQPSHVTITVTDVSGRAVRTLVNADQQQGRYQVTWDLSGVSESRLANGVYFCRMTAGDFTSTRKLVMQR